MNQKKNQKEWESEESGQLEEITKRIRITKTENQNKNQSKNQNKNQHTNQKNQTKNHEQESEEESEIVQKAEESEQE